MATGTNAPLINAAVFIDYENVHKALVDKNTNVIRDGFFDKMREWFKDNGRRMVKVAIYCNFDNDDLYESHHQTLLQSYGVETIHTSNQGKNFADLQLTIDVMNAMYLNDNIDEFIIMSNDKDMTPLLNNVRYNKRKAVVITTGNLYNKALCSFADEQITYETIVSQNVARCLVDDLRDKLYDNLLKYFDNVFNKYQDAKTSGQTESFKHIGLDHFCGLQTKYCMLMLYEVYKCISDLNLGNKVLFYTYNFKGKTFIAVMPSDKKDLLIDENIINESDVLDYDIDEKIVQVYKMYKPKT